MSDNGDVFAALADTPVRLGLSIEQRADVAAMLDAGGGLTLDDWRPLAERFGWDARTLRAWALGYPEGDTEVFLLLSCPRFRWLPGMRMAVPGRPGSWWRLTLRQTVQGRAPEVIMVAEGDGGGWVVNVHKYLANERATLHPHRCHVPDLDDPATVGLLMMLAGCPGAERSWAYGMAAVRALLAGGEDPQP